MTLGDTVMLKPSAGLRVKDPVDLSVLNPGGQEKVLSTYWLRRIQDGDVVIVEQTEEE